MFLAYRFCMHWVKNLVGVRLSIREVSLDEVRGMDLVLERMLEPPKKEMESRIGKPLDMKRIERLRKGDAVVIYQDMHRRQKTAARENTIPEKKWLLIEAA